MSNDLRTRIETVLAENDGLCLDNDEERRRLTEQLLATFTDLDLFLVVRIHDGRVEEVRACSDSTQAAKELLEMG